MKRNNEITKIGVERVQLPENYIIMQLNEQQLSNIVKMLRRTLVFELPDGSILIPADDIIFMVKNNGIKNQNKHTSEKARI